MLRKSIFLFLIVAFPLCSCKKSHEEIVRPADRLAAHPQDPTKPAAVAGVTDAQLQTPEAIKNAVTACVEAIKAEPEEPRYQFELGRVLLLGGLVDEAREHLQAAAEKDHAAAYFYLGQIELDTSKALFQKAAAGKFKPADKLVGELKSIASVGSEGGSPYGLFLTIGGGVAIIAAAFILVRLRRRRSRPPPPLEPAQSTP